jgi:DNA-binding IclR family transcriptional regulator
LNRHLSNNYASKRPANLVQTIERVNNLLESLSTAPQGLSLGELAKKVSLPKGTTHRLVSSLTYFNYVKQSPSSRRYKLGFKLVTFGNMLLDQIDLRSESRPFLFELAQKTQETTHLAVLDINEALYIDKIQLSSEGFHMTSRIGFRAPLHCTAVGKILLAHMPPEQIEWIVAQKGLPRSTVHTLTDTEQLKSHLQRIKR